MRKINFSLGRDWLFHLLHSVLKHGLARIRNSMCYRMMLNSDVSDDEFFPSLCPCVCIKFTFYNLSLLEAQHILAFFRYRTSLRILKTLPPVSLKSLQHSHVVQWLGNTCEARNPKCLQLKCPGKAIQNAGIIKEPHQCFISSHPFISVVVIESED